MLYEIQCNENCEPVYCGLRISVEKRQFINNDDLVVYAARDKDGDLVYCSDVTDGLGMFFTHIKTMQGFSQLEKFNLYR